MTHLTPSNVLLPCLTDFVLFPLGFRRREIGFVGRLGLAFFSLNVGFLCVISDLGTCFKVLVIPSPRLIWEKTALIEAPFSAGADGFGGIKDSGGGGGGGGGGPPVDRAGGAGADAPDPEGADDMTVLGELVPINVSAGSPLSFHFMP